MHSEDRPKVSQNIVSESEVKRVYADRRFALAAQTNSKLSVMDSKSEEKAGARSFYKRQRQKRLQKKLNRLKKHLASA